MTDTESDQLYRIRQAYEDNLAFVTKWPDKRIAPRPFSFQDVGFLLAIIKDLEDELWSVNH